MALDFDALEAALPELCAQYTGAEPYPHIVLDDFFPESVEAEAEREFPPLSAEAWLNFTHVNERKYSNTDPDTWGPTLQDMLADLQSDRFVAFLRELTGIQGLMRDESLEGGGLHQTPRDGFLNIGIGGMAPGRNCGEGLGLAIAFLHGPPGHGADADHPLPVRPTACRGQRGPGVGRQDLFARHAAAPA